MCPALRKSDDAPDSRLTRLQPALRLVPQPVRCGKTRSLLAANLVTRFSGMCQTSKFELLLPAPSQAAVDRIAPSSPPSFGLAAFSLSIRQSLPVEPQISGCHTAWERDQAGTRCSRRGLPVLPETPVSAPSPRLNPTHGRCVNANPTPYPIDTHVRQLFPSGIQRPAPPESPSPRW